MNVLIIIASVAALAFGAPELNLEHNSAEGKWDNVVIHLKAADPTDLDVPVVAQNIALHAEASQRNFVENRLTSLIESFRDVVIHGYKRIPPLDPLQVDNVGPFVFTVTAVRSTLNLDDLNVDGLRWYTVDQVSFNMFTMRLRVHLTIPRIVLTTNYNVRTRLALFIVHNSAGNLRFELNRLEVAVNTRLGTSIWGGNMYLRDLDIKLTAASSFVKVTGMTGSSLINAVISSTVNSLSDSVVTGVLDDLSAQLSAQLFVVINDILRDNSIYDIIGS